jgi:hypothetical protein
MQQEIEYAGNLTNTSDQQQKNAMAKSLYYSKVLKAAHKNHIVEERDLSIDTKHISYYVIDQYLILYLFLTLGTM